MLFSGSRSTRTESYSFTGPTLLGELLNFHETYTSVLLVDMIELLVFSAFYIFQ